MTANTANESSGKSGKERVGHTPSGLAEAAPALTAKTRLKEVGKFGLYVWSIKWIPTNLKKGQKYCVVQHVVTTGSYRG